MPVQRFDNFELYYEIHGTGTPVMLVPGLAGIGDYWTPQIEALAKKIGSFEVGVSPQPRPERPGRISCISRYLHYITVQIHLYIL